MPQSYTIPSGVLYDEGLNQRGTGTWAGYAMLGLTEFPYPLGCYDVYPGDEQGLGTLKALTLDTQDAARFYPRYKFGKDDTGRIIRFHFTDGGADFDLETLHYTVSVYSYKQSDDTVVRNGVDITTIGGTRVNSGYDGYVEWNLGATDTAQSFKYYLTVTRAGEVWTFPTYGYLYADAFDPTVTEWESGSGRALIRIVAGDKGKAFTFNLRDIEGADLNLETTSASFKFGKPASFVVTPSTVAMTGESFDGEAVYTLATGNFGSAGTYAAWITLTTRASKTVTVPSDRHIIIEVD